ncbi:MAG: hypothetical protein RIB93_16735 [Coleofasciculus sp. D1-CHI-01]|uniref:hypothetical protein n=1 Tax=Coleofasciculus sp. D1-CHI-01 TaxID=3068482 RepID=UPI0032F4B917
MLQFLINFQRRIGKMLWALSLITLINLGGLLLLSNQAALADSDTPLTTPPKTEKTELGLSQQEKEEAYEEATEALSKDPKKGVKKLYEEEKEKYEESQPDKNVLEKAKDMIEGLKNTD